MASFTRFKDRIWSTASGLAQAAAASEGPMRAVGYGTLRAFGWTLYALPFSPLRRTARNYARVVGAPGGRALYAGFLNRFFQGFVYMEHLRLGRVDEVDALLDLPERARLDDLMAAGNGVVLVLPHCHATMLAARGLSRDYPQLTLVRLPLDPARSEAIARYYDHIAGDLLDVRGSPDATVARTILRALRQGRLVIGVTDRIKPAPAADAPTRKGDDTVRATAFGQPMGAVGWPVRFAATAGAPILPAMVRLAPGRITMHLGETIRETDPVAATQAWVTALEQFFRRYPMDWGFVYDKHWSRVLEAAATAPAPSVETPEPPVATTE